jgi:phage shock protein PspC (stress-responsive transcriptional regulator)
MNKTIIININGIVFHIEEDAYEVLRVYMTEVKRHFAYSPDSEEIVGDIENRLAEMFSERLAKDNKQVVVLQDVQEVTAQMGNASDFDVEEDEPVYTAANESSFKQSKKLFRDMDDRIIGGVCAGVGHYFDIEPRWMRLITLLMFFFGGTGLMLYIILWIVMPKAATRADKMAMKGEPINLQNFKKNFDEEVENVRHGIKRAHHEARPAIDKFGRFLSTIGKIFIKIIGGFILFIGAMTLLGLIIGLLSFLGLWQAGETGPFPNNLINPEYKSALSFGVFVSLFIPIVALLLFAIRVLFNRKVVTRTGAFAMLIIWLGGLGLAAYYGIKTGIDFNEEASFSQVTDIKPSEVYYLKLNSEKYLSRQDSLDYKIDSSDFKGRIIINGRSHNFNYDNIDLIIEKAAVDKPTLTQEFSAKGPDFESALTNARNIKYQVRQTDSVLQFDRNMYIGKNALFRDQQMTLILRVPNNTRLKIEGNLNRYLQDHKLRECQPDDSSDDFLSEWIMTDDGLKCKDDSLYKKNRNED